MPAAPSSNPLAEAYAIAATHRAQRVRIVKVPIRINIRLTWMRENMADAYVVYAFGSRQFRRRNPAELLRDLKKLLGL